MAISSIEITQDNIVSGCDLLAVHNPLVFIAEVTYSGDAPDFVYVRIETGSDLDDYKAIYLDDISGIKRRFYFVADEILRSYLPELSDTVQTANTTIEINNLTTDITLSFRESLTGGVVSDLLTFTIVHAARDFQAENGASMVDICNNESKYYVTGLDQSLYLYAYNDNASNKVADLTDLGIANNLTLDDTITATLNYLVNNNPAYIDEAGDKFIQATKDLLTNELTLTAVNGNIITFNATLPIGGNYTAVVSNNGTSSASIVYSFSGNPSDEEIFQLEIITAIETLIIDTFYGMQNTTTYAKGFIRKKIEPDTLGLQELGFAIEYEQVAHNLNVRNWCDGDILVKYIDNDGQFRYFPFSKFYRTEVNSEEIGKINPLILSIKDQGSNQESIGYKSNNRITLTAELINYNDREVLSFIYNSKLTYLIIDGKEIQVNVSSGDRLKRLEKIKFSQSTITFDLPQSYNITSL